MEGGHYYCAYPQASTRMVKGALDGARAVRAAGARLRAARARRRSRPPTSGSSSTRRRTSDGRVPQPRRRRLLADGVRADRRRPRGRGARRSRRCRSAPRARWRGSTTLHFSRIQIFRSSSTRGRQRSRDRLRAQPPRVHEHVRRRARPVPGRAASASAPRPTLVGPLRRLPGHRRPRGVQALDPRPPGRQQPVRLRPPGRDGARTCARASRCASGSSTSPPRRRGSTPPSCSGASGHLRGRALMARARCASGARGTCRGGAPRRPTSTSPTSRATSCAATPIPSAAYLFLRIDDVDRARALLTRDAAAGGDRRAVGGRPAADARCTPRSPTPAWRRSGVPDDDARRVPGRVPRGHGGARRAARRPRAERARALGGRPRDRRGARARHGLRDRRGAARAAAASAARRRRRRGATTVVHEHARRGAAGRARPLRLLRRDRAAGRRGQRRGAAARATASPTAPAAGATVRTGEFLHGYEDEDGGLPEAPAAPFDRNGTFEVYRKLHMDVAAFRRFVGRARARATRAAPICWRPRSSAAGATARRSSARPSARTPRSPPTRRGSTTSPTPTDPSGLRCPLGAHIRRANPRDAEGFFDGRLTNRHRIIRRGRTYGPPLPEGVMEDDGVERGLVFVCFNASIWRQFETIQALWIDDGDPFGLGRRQGLPHRRARRRRRQDDDPGPPAVLPQAAAALRDDARRRVPLPAEHERPALAGGRAAPRRIPPPSCLDPAVPGESRHGGEGARALGRTPARGGDPGAAPWRGRSRSPSSSIGCGSGALLPVHRGVYRVGHRAPSVDARYLAAVLACGERRAAQRPRRRASARAPQGLGATAGGDHADGAARAGRQDATIAPRRLAADATTWRRIPHHHRRTHPHGPREGPRPRCPGPGLPRGRGPLPHHARAGRSRARPTAQHARAPPSCATSSAETFASPSASSRSDSFDCCARKGSRSRRRTALPAAAAWTAAGPSNDSPSSSTATSSTTRATPGNRIAAASAQAHARGDEFRRYTYGDVFEHPTEMLTELRALLPRARLGGRRRLAQRPQLDRRRAPADLELADLDEVLVRAG